MTSRGGESRRLVVLNAQQVLGPKAERGACLISGRESAVARDLGLRVLALTHAGGAWAKWHPIVSQGLSARALFNRVSQACF